VRARDVGKISLSVVRWRQTSSRCCLPRQTCVKITPGWYFGTSRRGKRQEVETSPDANRRNCLDRFRSGL